MRRTREEPSFDLNLWHYTLFSYQSTFAENQIWVRPIRGSTSVDLRVSRKR